jgi:hypothetical protein
LIETTSAAGTLTTCRSPRSTNAGQIQIGSASEEPDRRYGLQPLGNRHKADRPFAPSPRSLPRTGRRPIRSCSSFNSTRAGCADRRRHAEKQVQFTPLIFGHDNGCPAFNPASVDRKSRMLSNRGDR